MANGLLKATTNMLSKHGSSIGEITNIGLTSYFAYDGYTTSIEQGNSEISSVVTGASDAIIPMFLGVKGFLALEAIKTIPSLIVEGTLAYDRYGRNLARQGNNVPFANAVFNETQQSYTMRQAGMQLAQRSKYNLQQTLIGNEAQYMHR